MRFREVSYKDQISLIVYLTEEERNSADIAEKVNRLKGLYKNIAIFISGDVSAENILKTILNGSRK